MPRPKLVLAAAVLRPRYARPMADLSPGHVTAQALADCGVDVVFTLMSGHTTPVVDAFPELGLRVIDVRHEEAAAHMAHGYARATGRPGVAMVAAGPGLTNSASGVAHAWSSGSPMVVIVGRAPLAQSDLGALHDMDQLSFMRPITKWAASVLDAARLPEYVERGLRVARLGRPGPVLLEMPSDVLRSELVMEPARVGASARARPAADPDTVSAAAELLAGAERPLVLAGSGVFWADASHALVALLERLQSPVLVSQAARGIVPFEHPSHVPAARSKAMGGADVVLVVGSRLNFMWSYGQPPRWNADAKVIQIDINPDEIGNNRAIDVALAGDADVVLGQLLAELDQHGERAWLDELSASDRERRAGLRGDSHIDDAPVHPLRLISELANVLEPDAFVTADGGDILSFTRQALPSTSPGGWLDSGPFGSLGFGIPAASAAKFASPQRQCVAVVGDGAFGLQAMELDTAARHGLGILVVISNNGAWAIEATSMEMEFGRAIATDIERRPYHALAESLGCDGIEVTEPGELADALARAPRDRPLVVSVETDPAAKSPDAVRGLGLVPRKQAVEFQ